MQLKVMILIILILVSSGVSALNFDEKINVNGNGYMLSRTNTEQSSDLAEGHGDQTYHRILSSQLGVSSLTSNYNLKSDNFTKNYRYSLKFNRTMIDYDIYGENNLVNSAYLPNRYSISMRSPTGLRHTISTYGLSGEGVGNLNSSSSISFNPVKAQPSPEQTSQYTVSTSFDINGNGSLSEAVTDLSLGKHPANVAETSIYGNFDVNSRLSNALTLPGSEAQDQLAKADSVIPVSDMPQQNNSTIIVADLENRLNTGRITQDDYLNEIHNLLKTRSIDESQYATSLTSEFNSGFITLSYADYTDRLHEATPGTLTKLNALVNKGLIPPEVYLTSLKRMLDDNRLSEIEYLSAIKATENVTKANESSIFKNDTLNEMESKFANGVIDWTTYSTRLIEMLNLGLINTTDYNIQIDVTSKVTISKFEQMLDKGLINETQFVCALKKMKDENRFSETGYDRELRKINMSESDASRLICPES